MIDDDPLRQFAGYTDKKASEKKILTDVFQKGDRYFRTGDLLRIDKVNKSKSMPNFFNFFFFFSRVVFSILLIELVTLFDGKEKMFLLVK